MSFARWAECDIYLFESVGGWIECCGCHITKAEEDELFGFAILRTPREALEHLDKHEAVGDDIGGARRRIEKQYPDLDVNIEPYRG